MFLMPNSNPLTWQLALQRIIRSSAVRQRLATSLGINTITLQRWSKANSNPQRSHLLRLVKAVQHRDRAELMNALLDAYPDLREKLQRHASEVVPPAHCREI